MTHTIRWIVCLAMPFMAINAADAQLERMKSSYDKAMETAQEKYTQRREKLEQELKAEKDKQFAILMTAYNDVIKRTTQKGDLEQANALLAERKQYEADHADEALRSAKTTDKKETPNEVPKASILPREEHPR
jgi:arginine utilization protein RocB